MTTRSLLSYAAFPCAFLAIAIMAGCAHDAPPAATATTSTMLTTTPVASSPGKGNSSIYLSGLLRQACGITVVESRKDAPTFAFDQNAINTDDRDVLARVAECLTMGPLKGRSVKLIGRADPRGTTEYNMALGERRANAVLKYLASSGVATSQMTETSRGSLDATGNDDAAWQSDRRVDIDVLSAP